MMKKHTNQYITWWSFLKNETNKNYFYHLIIFLTYEYTNYNIFPRQKQILRSLEIEFKNIKVVIFGQDPYYKKDLANGLSFSVSKSINNIPPSLKNIYNELQYDVKIQSPKHGDLISWTKQGVLLLNTILTVREGIPLSHANKGWELFTNSIIKNINKYHENVVFLLLGTYAKNKKFLINKNKNFIIETTHPSPHSAQFGFLGSRCFSKINTYLKKTGQKEINWNI